MGSHARICEELALSRSRFDYAGDLNEQMEEGERREGDLLRVKRWSVVVWPSVQN